MWAHVVQVGSRGSFGVEHIGHVWAVAFGVVGLDNDGVEALLGSVSAGSPAGIEEGRDGGGVTER
jgi:hypothetical protein